MVRAIWNDITLAESKNTKMVEGNHYFPPEDVHKEHLKESDHHTTCPWKGVASYYNVEGNGKKSENATWYYPDPKTDAAMPLMDYIAFWKDVEITED